MCQRSHNWKGMMALRDSSFGLLVGILQIPFCFSFFMSDLSMARYLVCGVIWSVTMREHPKDVQSGRPLVVAGLGGSRRRMLPMMVMVFCTAGRIAWQQLDVEPKSGSLDPQTGLNGHLVHLLNAGKLGQHLAVQSRTCVGAKNNYKTFCLKLSRRRTTWRDVARFLFFLQSRPSPAHFV